MSFSLPALFENPTGWGPGDQVPEAFKDIPFTPFNKADKVGRVIDFDAVQYTNPRGRAYPTAASSSAASSFTYKHEEDESTFQLVDSSSNKSQQKKSSIFGNTLGRKPYQQRQRSLWQQRAAAGSRASNQQNMARGQMSKGRGGVTQVQGRRDMRQGVRRPYFDKVIRPREPSMLLPDTWPLVATLSLADLAKVKADEVPQAEDLMMCGSLDSYDTTFDQLTAKSDKSLKKFESRHFFTNTTSEDHILQNFAQNKEGTVFATDSIISVLMASYRSVFSWDLVIEKRDGQIFIDKRPKSQIDVQTVNESAADNGMSVEEESNVNHFSNLAIEATLLNHNFSQQALSKDAKNRWTLANPHPFADSLEVGLEPASTAFRYRRFHLAGGHTLVVRTEINAFAPKKGSDKEGDRQLLMIRALNEFDSKLTGSVDWRQKLDSQKASIFATEVKNNQNKLTRWAAQACLAGVDEIKMGYVSRLSTRAADSHVILGVQRFKTAELPQHVGVDMGKMWAMLRRMLDMINKMDDGKYLMMKDPNEASLKVYQVPDEVSLLDDEEASEVDFD